MPEDTKPVADSFEVEVTNPESNETNKVRVVKFVPVKGKGAGIPKFYPENIEALTLDWFVKVYGPKQVLRTFVRPRFKQMLSAFTADALVREDGKPETDIDVQKKDFSEMFSTLSKRGETLADINNRITEIVGDATEEGEILQAINANNYELARELKDELSELRKAYAQKKAARAAKTPAENAAATAAASAEPVTA